MHFDVIVAGGGFAGVGAAVSAARHGRRVLLIDRNGALGGAANESLVMPFMPYFTFVPDGEGKMRRVDLVRGIFSEISAALRVEGADAFFDPLLFDSERLKTVLDDLVTEAGVQVLFHTTVAEAVIDDGRLTAVRAYACGQMMTFSADVFVDATGDGALAALCGCRFHVGREEDGLCQPMTLCFRVGGVDYAAFSRELPAMQALYKQRQAEGKIQNPREDLLVFPTPHKGLIHFNSTRILRTDPTDPFALSRAEMEGRRQMRELFAFLQEDFPLFSEAYIVSCAASIGVRESRMVVGEHRLTGEELVAQCAEAGVQVCAIPGPCALVTALAAVSYGWVKFCPAKNILWFLLDGILYTLLFAVVMVLFCRKTPAFAQLKGRALAILKRGGK